MYDTPKVESLTITPTGFTVVWRRHSNAMLACNPPRPVPDRVWRETYEARVADGSRAILELAKTEEGKHRPTHIIPDTIVWPEDEEREASMAKSVLPPHLGPTIYGR
jgi:hypothetical protein